MKRKKRRKKRKKVYSNKNLESSTKGKSLIIRLTNSDWGVPLEWKISNHNKKKRRRKKEKVRSCFPEKSKGRKRDSINNFGLCVEIKRKHENKTLEGEVSSWTNKGKKDWWTTKNEWE